MSIIQSIGANAAFFALGGLFLTVSYEYLVPAFTDKRVAFTTNATLQDKLRFGFLMSLLWVLLVPAVSLLISPHLDYVVTLPGLVGDILFSGVYFGAKSSFQGSPEIVNFSFALGVVALESFIASTIVNGAFTWLLGKCKRNVVTVDSLRSAVQAGAASGIALAVLCVPAFVIYCLLLATNEALVKSWWGI